MMNSENFYFDNASKTSLGKKISRLYLIGIISKEEYTDKIRNIADKMKADDAYVENLNIESIKNNLDACINLFETIDIGDDEGIKRNIALLEKIQSYYERFNIARTLGYVEDGFRIASSLISKEKVLKPYEFLKSDEEIKTACKKPDSWLGLCIFLTAVVIEMVVISWYVYQHTWHI